MPHPEDFFHLIIPIYFRGEFAEPKIPCLGVLHLGFYDISIDTIVLVNLIGTGLRFSCTRIYEIKAIIRWHSTSCYFSKRDKLSIKQFLCSTELLWGVVKRIIDSESGHQLKHVSGSEGKLSINKSCKWLGNKKRPFRENSLDCYKRQKL